MQTLNNLMSELNNNIEKFLEEKITNLKWIELDIRKQVRLPKDLIDDKPGVYIIAFSSDNLEGKKLQLFDKNKNIVYIGSSGNVRTRLNNFVGAAMGGNQKHSGGKSFYNHYGNKINKEYKNYKCYFSYFFVEDIFKASDNNEKDKIEKFSPFLIEYYLIGLYTLKNERLPELNKGR